MTSATDLAGTAAGEDPEIGLRALTALRDLLERLEFLHVQHARARGSSWQEIADLLGVSRQAVHKKYRGRIA